MPRDDQPVAYPETRAADVDFSELLDSDSGLNPENDVAYLLGLIGGALEDDQFDTDHEAAAWAVSQWCQELRYVPDLSDYSTGQCVGTASGAPPNQLV